MIIGLNFLACSLVVRDGTWTQLTEREAAAAEGDTPDALRLRSFWVPRFAQRDLADFAVGARMLAHTWRVTTPSNNSACPQCVI